MRGHMYEKRVSDAHGIKERKRVAIPETLLKVFHLLITCLDVMTQNMLEMP